MEQDLYAYSEPSVLLCQQIVMFETDSDRLRTGGHSLSFGNSIFNPKSRFNKLLVSCLSQSQLLISGNSSERVNRLLDCLGATEV